MSKKSKKKKSITDCALCTQLDAKEYGFYIYGQNQYDKYLPAAASQLTLLKDFKPYNDRKLQLKQCPQCDTYYLYETDYEFLVNGSENEETLTRLTDAEAAPYLQRAAPE